MSYRRTATALRAALAPDRFVLVYAADEAPWPAGHVEAIADALANGLDVEFHFTRGDLAPWFRLRSFRGALHVLSGDFRHLATMASIPAALARGWELGSWAGLIEEAVP